MAHRIIAHDCLMAWLAQQKEEWLVCVQELYLTKKDMSRLPKDYCAFWSDKVEAGNTKPRAAIILPRKWNAYMITQFSHSDCIVVRIEELKLSIISLYCPDERDIGRSWEMTIRECMMHKKVIICADVNAYHEMWGSNIKKNQRFRARKRGKEIVEILDENMLEVCNITPHRATFVRNEGKTDKVNNMSHIDATFCTGESKICIQGWKVRDELFQSDYRGIEFQYVSNIRKVRGMKEEISGVPWKKTNDRMMGKMSKKLSKDVKYKRRINCISDIDLFISKDGEQIRGVLNDIFKEKTKRKKERKVFWWMEEVRQCHDKLKAARRRIRRYKFEDLKIVFNLCRSAFRKAVEKAKIKAWRLFTTGIKNPWDGIVRIIKATSVRRSNNRTLSDLEGQFAEDMKQTLILLGNQFYPTPVPMLESHKDVECKVECKLEIGDGIKCVDITECEPRTALDNIPMATAPGFDQITNNVIKIMVNDSNFAPIYLKVFNECIKKAYFPQIWKKAKIVLIPKALTMLDSVKALRPISLTSALSKLLERIVLARISYYLEKSESLTNNQHAYRKGKSIQTALYELFELVQYTTNRKEVCMIVFLDISGAFDRTWHYGILNKLLEYGVPTYLVAWMKLFLAGRTAFFEAAAEKHEVPLEQGCPQGEVLSPALWNVLFNDMLSLFQYRVISIEVTVLRLLGMLTMQPLCVKLLTLLLHPD